MFVFQQHNQLRERVFTLSHRLSAMTFGQDRYRRRYWVLPKCGGILVEGLESGEPESADPHAPEIDRKIEEAVDEEKRFKPVIPPAVEESRVNLEQVDNGSIPTDFRSGTEVKTEEVDVGPTPRHDEQIAELPLSVKMDVNCDSDQAENLLIKQESDSVKSNNCRALEAELVSLKCLIGDEVKLKNTAVDCKNGFVDLKNRIRSDADCVKVEPLPLLSLSPSVSDRKLVNSCEDSSMDTKKHLAAAEVQLISAGANVLESAMSDSVHYCLSSKPVDDQLPRTPNKDDVSLLQQSSMLQLAVSNAGITQTCMTDSQGYSLASSQRTSQVATPSSEVGAGLVLDMSTAGTPVSFMQPSRTSTPGYMSTSITDDLQLSADGELQPDYLAVPQNVQPISLGNLPLF